MSKETEEIAIPEQVFDRAGHVTELAGNQYLLDDLDDGQRAVVQAHLEECAQCAARIEAVEAHDRKFELKPSNVAVALAAEKGDPTAKGLVSLQERRAAKNEKRAFIGIGIAAAAAIALTVWVMPSDEPDAPAAIEEDGIRMKGGALDVEVFANDGRESRAVHNGDVVRPGERLGFKVTAKNPGYLLIAGVDDTGQVYPVHPSSGSATHTDPVEASDLESAIQLDDVGAKERIVAALCEQPFDLAAIKPTLTNARGMAAAAPKEDPFGACVYDEVVLKKEPR